MTFREAIGVRVDTDIAKEIADNISDTIEILKTIKPIYNFKAAE